VVSTFRWTLESWGPPSGRTSTGGGRRFLLRFRGLLAAFRGLRAELLRESLDSAFGIDQLLTAGEERMAGRADFKMQLVLCRSRLERIAARAAHFDLVVLRMDAFLHSVLLGFSSKPPL